MSNHIRNYLDFAIDTVYQAGRLSLGYFRTDIPVSYKGDDSVVTVADRKIEEFIRLRIEQRFPGHFIIGEEYDKKIIEGTNHCWFIDPIDGTKLFIKGIPLYAILLGLEIDGNSKVGVVYFPALDEIVYAATGEGCYWNGRRTWVKRTEELNRCFVSFADPASFEKQGRLEVLERIKKAVYCRLGLTDAYGHALVATGRLDLMVDPIMKPWDCGPFPVILREAGGYFGDWSGNETIYCTEAISTTKTLLPEILNLIRR